VGYLLFFISSFFAFIFYNFFTFSQGKSLFLKEKWVPYLFSSLSGNLLIEVIVFLFLGFFFLFYFFEKWKKEDWEDDLNKFIKKNILDIVNNFFNYYLYYLWFLLFYISIFIVFHHFHIHFSLFIFSILCFVWMLFFLSKSFFIVRDFIKINTFLFSLIYLFLFLFHFFYWGILFDVFDFINTWLLLLFFWVTLYIDKVVLKKEKNFRFLIFFFFYLFIDIVFYLSFFLSSLSFSVSLVWFFLSLMLFFIIPEIPFFEKNIVPLRFSALIYNYISIVSTFVYFWFFGFNIILISILFISSFFHFYIHNEFENYISFSFWILAFIVGVFSVYFHFFFLWEISRVSLLIFSFFLEFLGISMTYFFYLREKYDYYIIYTFSYSVILFWIVYFFILNGFDIFTFWIILFLLSLSIFTSYYKINSLSK